MVILYMFLFYLNSSEPVMITDGPMTVEQCRKYGESLKEIRSLFKADGATLLCKLVESKEKDA
jgi:hypothetical protein